METHNDVPATKDCEADSKKYPFPKSVFFIISNEFCERFNYNGMRSVLVLYFTRKLLFDENTATVLYHASTTLVYFLCIFGAIVSDSWLGKFKTIFYLSMVYAMGSLIIAAGAIPTLNLPATYATIVGLVLIGIGSGGIKPCIAAFGGDQFRLPEQLPQMAAFFSVFYFTINAGSLISTFVTPILRQDVHCFDENDCYSLAFGVPGVLMIFSIIFFLCGKPLYRINPPSGNMVSQVTKCIKNAIVTKRRDKKTNPREHWLDYSEEKYGKQLVTDTKVLLKVLVLYIPLPLFWALLDQQGSRWTFQATRMDGDVGLFYIKPDQMLVVHPFLVLVFIPLFQTLIYPLLVKVGIRRPLQKMTIGGLLAAIAFLLSGLVQLELERIQPVVPANGQAQLRVINGLPCNFTVDTTIPSIEPFTLNPFQMFEQTNIIDLGLTDVLHHYTFNSNDSICPARIWGKLSLPPNEATTLFMSGPQIQDADVYADDPQKSQAPLLRVLFSSLGNTSSHQVKIIKDNRVVFTGNSTHRDLFPVLRGEHEVHVDGQHQKTLTLKDGSVSTLVVSETPNEPSLFQLNLIEITPPNSMSILWQLPQYIVMTLGEVMFAVTGLGFSYAQAPLSMKSVVQACWLLTIAFGSLIITVIAGAKIFESQANEFFLFMGLMTLDMLLFMILAKNFKGVVPYSESIATPGRDRTSNEYCQDGPSNQTQ